MYQSRLAWCLCSLAAALTVAGCNGSNSQAQNQPPVIAGSSAITVDEDTVLPLSFTINDLETPLSSLTVTATSSDVTVVPAANVTVSGAGANRTVTLTPLPDVVGTTTITVTVKDGNGLTATATVPVTFREVRLDFPNYSRQAFAVSPSGTALTLTQEKFTFSGDGDNGFLIYKDLIGP